MPILQVFLFLGTFLLANSAFATDNAASIVRDAVNYWRDQSSHTVAALIVHRPDWERSMDMEGWTSGSKRTLVRFTAPPKDAGSASLTVDDEMWSYSPKINKVVKIPPSMKGSSWMGSDFSYKDLSKNDDIIDEYDHHLLREELSDGKKVFVIESIPHDDAAVVWGKEILKIREDRIILEHEFYDQSQKLIKRLSAREIKELGGKLYATVVRMEKIDPPGEWTEVKHTAASFGINVPESVFTLSNLSSPRNLPK